MNVQISTDFMNFVGRPTMSFNTNTATAWSHTRIRAVRVLDNTGSIAVNGKLAAMRSPAENMIDTLSTDNTTDGGAYAPIDRQGLAVTEHHRWSDRCAG